MSLKAFAASEKRRNANELYEYVLIPLLKRITVVKEKLSSLSKNTSDPIETNPIWKNEAITSWDVLREMKPHRISELPRNLFKKIDGLCKDLRKYDFLAEQRLDDFHKVLQEILQKEFGAVYSQKYGHDRAIEISGAANTGLWVYIGGQRHIVTVFKLLFGGIGLDDYLSELVKREGLPNSEIETESFNISGMNLGNRSDFLRVYAEFYEKVKSDKALMFFVTTARDLNEKTVRVEKAIRKKFKI